MNEPLALAGKPTREEVEEMVRLHVVDRLSLSQVGKRVGRSTSSVKGIVARNRALALAMSAVEEIPKAYEPWVSPDDITAWQHPETGKMVSVPRLRCLERRTR